MANLRDTLRKEETSVLLYQLSKSDTDTQRRIIHELGRRKAMEAMGQLLMLLDHPAPHTRAAAAEALGHVGYSAAGDRLLRLFIDSSQPVEVRDTCAYALGKIQYKPALRPLLSALSDPATSVRQCAFSALIAIGGEMIYANLRIHAELERDESLRQEMLTVLSSHPARRPSYGLPHTLADPVETIGHIADLVRPTGFARRERAEVVNAG